MLDSLIKKAEENSQKFLIERGAIPDPEVEKKKNNCLANVKGNQLRRRVNSLTLQFKESADG